MFNRCGVMALVAAYLNFLSQMIANPPFCQHVSKVGEVPHLLLLLLPASDSSTFSGDRAEEHEGTVSSARTRVQRQVSVSLHAVRLLWRTLENVLLNLVVLKLLQAPHVTCNANSFSIFEIKG